MSDAEKSALLSSGSKGYGGATKSTSATDVSDKSGSLEADVIYSPSYEKVKAKTYESLDGSSPCTRKVCLLSGFLVFFMLTSIALAVTLGVVLTRDREQQNNGNITVAAPTVYLANIQDFEEYAHKVLDPNAWNYFSSGATDEVTLHDNKAAYRRLRIRPIREVNVSGAATSLPMMTFGGNISVPIGFSPTASHWWAHPDGEVATARAAVNLNTVMVVSIDSTTFTKRLAMEVPDALLWQQMYIFGDEKDTLYMVKLAEDSGCKAVVLTIDKPAPTIRYADLRNQIKYPADYPSEGNYPPNMSSTSGYFKERDWNEVRWLTQQTSLPVIVKGVLTSTEARKAIDHGASAILISNHGGRALDGVPATIDQLTEVAAEVKGQVPVYIDGGIRSGMDVFKALALGADMVFLGRPILWGLAHSGQQGVEKVMDLVTKELVNTMQLAGANNLTEIKPNFVYRPFEDTCQRT